MSAIRSFMSSTCTHVVAIVVGIVLFACAAATVAQADYRTDMQHSAQAAQVAATQAQTLETLWSPGVRFTEEHPLFDCRIDGDQHCGPTAQVPVPVTGGSYTYMPITQAPAPTWRS